MKLFALPSANRTFYDITMIDGGGEVADRLLLFQVDAFTADAFAGNPAAVCLLEREMSDKWMQAVAAEMNLSETAFLLLIEHGYSLRWFTPVAEVELCGHATLAAAHILWEEKLLEAAEKARFFTRSGPLFASYNKPWIELDFPLRKVVQTPAPNGLYAALGLTESLYTGKSAEDYLLELESEDAVRKLKPDFRRLRKISAGGVIVTAKASTGSYDFVSRFFAPSYGIDEDPVTGSAHCALGPYWRKKLGKERMLALQVSGRGGELYVVPTQERVLLSGRAITVLRGELLALDEPGG